MIMGKANDIKKIRVTESIILKQIEFIDSKDIFETIDSQREYLGKWLPFVDITKKIEDTQNFIQTIINVPTKNFEYMFVIHYNSIFAGLIGFKLEGIERDGELLTGGKFTDLEVYSKLKNE